MNNIVHFFDQSTVHISNWPNNVLHWLYWLTLVWPLAHSCFWAFGNLVGNFFRSISQCSIRSIRPRSVNSVFYDWPNFFSRSRLRSIRTLRFRSRLTESHSVNAKFWSIRVLQLSSATVVCFTLKNGLNLKWRSINGWYFTLSRA